MPRYEFSEGSSNKFWEITLQGKSFVTRYGRIGTDGAATTKEFASEAEARHAYDKLVAEKTKKGYALVGEGDGGGADDDDGDGDAAAPAGARNPELERAILDHPDDVDSYLVYGDWLQSQGDSRGELIAVQAALHKMPSSKELKKTETALIKKHAGDWLGALAKSKALQPVWRLGFVDELTMSFNSFDDEEVEDEGGGVLLQKLLATPAGRLLRKLHVKLWSNDGQADYAPIAAALIEAAPPALRDLYLADFGYPDEIEMSWTELGDLSSLWRALPRLDKLILQGGSMTLGDITAPALRHFEARTGGLSDKSVASIAAAKWPELETLMIWFGSEDYGGGGTLEAIAPILDGKGLGKLRHLGLMNCPFVDEVCGALAGSKVVKQLQTLDLSMGTMSIAGAQRLDESARQLAHLTRIDVEDNELDDAAQALLKKHKNIHVGKQRENDDPEYRYVSVGE